MTKLSNLLLEGANLYKVDILIKTAADANKVEIYNQIRAIKNVVVVTVEQNDFLQSKSTSSPKESIEEIKKIAMITERIYGLLQFIIRYKTIQLKGKY